MSFTIQQLQDAISPKIHGTSIAKLGNFYGTVYEASINLLARIDPKETMRIKPFASHIYDRIYDYTVPDDLKDDAIVDIRPVAERLPSDDNRATFSLQFDVNKGQDKGQDWFTIRNNNGVKTLRIDKRTEHSAILVNSMDSTTADGTWTAGGDASNIATDGNSYLSGAGSVKFDLSGVTGSGYIENSTMSAKDLSSIEDIGALFQWLYSSSNAFTLAITNVKIRIGSSSTDYYEMTATTPQDRSSFQDYWNLVKWNMVEKTMTGTPNLVLSTYVRVQINYTTGTAFTAISVDNIIGQLGSPYEIEYYSQCLFKNASGTWIERPTALTDTINLSTTSYNILFYETMKLLLQEVKSKSGSFDYSHYVLELEGTPPKRQGDNGKKGLYEQYADKFPSQRISTQTTYYDFES